MRERRLERGIFATPWGYRVSVRIHGHNHRKSFPKTVTLAIMRRWREDIRRAHQSANRPRIVQRGTVADDISDYLRAVRAMPTYADRARDIRAWLERFGHRARWSLTPLEIRTQLNEWRSSGLAVSTVNHRRTALVHFFVTLDGKDYPHPVRHVPQFAAPASLPRAIPLSTVRTILSKMAPSTTKARLEVLAWTGIRPAELMALTPADINIKNGVLVIVTAKGGPARVVPLVKIAVDAVKRFVKRNAFGSFSLASARKVLHRACVKADVPPIRIYDLRHSLLTGLAAASRDERIVQQIAGHADQRTTHGYTVASIDPRVKEAMRRLGRTIGW